MLQMLGGRQGTLIYGIHNKKLGAKVGKLNLMKFDRSKLIRWICFKRTA